MRILGLVLGLLLVLVGGVWILQGARVLTQGFMAGDMRWTYIGIGVAVAGIALFLFGVAGRRRRR